jgi:hypothetical protein
MPVSHALASPPSPKPILPASPLALALAARRLPCIEGTDEASASTPLQTISPERTLPLAPLPPTTPSVQSAPQADFPARPPPPPSSPPTASQARKSFSARQPAHLSHQPGQKLSLRTQTASFVRNATNGSMCSIGIRTVICVISTNPNPNLFGVTVCMYARMNEMYESRINALFVCITEKPNKQFE